MDESRASAPRHSPVRWRAAHLDTLAAIAVACGVIGLFLLDISAPRGVVDGVGYAAVVALTVRLGRRILLAVATASTLLTVIAAFLLPDAGISVAGELANRFFAIATIWIVSAVLLSRVRLANEIAMREAEAKRHQEALVRVIHESLSSGRPLKDKIQILTELAGDAIEVDRTGVFFLKEQRSMFHCLDMWERGPRRHGIAADLPPNESPGYYETVENQLVKVSNDALNDPLLADRHALLRERNIGAVITVGIIVDRRVEGLVSFSHKNGPRRWTAGEIAFARSVTTVVALLLLVNRHQEALAALDLAREGIYVEDDAGRVIYANRAATGLAKGGSGAGSVESAGNSLLGLFPSIPAPANDGYDVREFTHLGRELEINRTRLPQGGAISRVTDVTARNTGMRERARLETSLQQAAKMHALGQLAGGVAHDFNNILGAIQGFARLIAEDVPPRSSQFGFAQRVLTACDRGRELVDQILAFSLTEVAERRVVDLAHVLRECEPLLIAALPRTTHLHFTYPRDEICVLAREVQMSQLIINLCRNASDSLEGRSGRVVIELSGASQSEIRGLAENPRSPGDFLNGAIDASQGYARIRVTDEGSGISPEILKRIFEPFFTTKGRRRGTGLGLAVVHGVIEAHGGACLVETAPGQGTSFSVYLPTSSRPPDGVSLATVSSRDSRGRERILIVDDEPDIADMLSIGLDRLGYVAVGINDPLEALAAFEEDPMAWDAVITDQLMPSMRGLDLAGRLKRIRPDIKTLLCTGFSDAAGGELTAGGEIDAFFRKPTDAQAIAVSLRELFDRENN